MAESDKDSGWRGSPEVWLDAAYRALLDGGIDAVKVLPLAQTLKLSRASFYWFFKDREALLDGLLARWHERNTGSLEQRGKAYAETIVEAVLNVCDCFFDDSLFDSRFEFAVRSWALQSDTVRQVVATADSARLGALTEMFRRFGYPQLAAEVRARSIYLIQIGYITMQTQESLALRMSRMPDYVDVHTGMAPKQNEMDRFLSRHGMPAGSVLVQPAKPGP